jgi:hypothetical protein
MNRRAFISGALATFGIAAAPHTVDSLLALAPSEDTLNSQAFWDQWCRDIGKVIGDCWMDQTLYGTSAFRQCEAYPYIERIPPAEISLPYPRPGLGLN